MNAAATVPALMILVLVAGCGETSGAGDPGYDVDRDAGASSLGLEVRTACGAEPLAAVGDAEPIRIGLTLTDGGRLAVEVRTFVRVTVTAGDSLALLDDGVGYLAGGTATVRARCRRPGAARLLGLAPELGLRSREVIVRCLEPAKYARACPTPPAADGAADATPPPADGGPFADAGPPRPALEPQPLERERLLAFGDHLTVAFRLRDAEGRPWPMQPVRLALEPPGGRHRLSTESVETDEHGFIRVEVQTRGDLGQIRVAATLEDDPTVAASSPAVTVIPGPLRPAGLRIDCGPPALAAFDVRAAPVAGRGRDCRVEARDPGGHPIPGVAVRLLAEAGVVPDEVVTGADGTAGFVYRTSVEGPTPVAPTPAAANGLATLVAIARGEEPFDDVAGDGVFDEGTDGFRAVDDLPEPWLDRDDDGARDDDEPFLDVDGDGAWSPPDGARQIDRPIFATGRLLWVGPHDPERSFVEVDCTDADCRPDPDCPTGFSVPRGGRARLRFVAADHNGNCLVTRPDARWTALWLDGPLVDGPLDTPCYGPDERPGAHPTVAALDRLGGPAGHDRVTIRLSVDYDSVHGPGRFTADTTLCLSH